ncbi:hypothetical protein BDD12DRAFT_807681 [Trichophaea hybrida]|nr:hypothetical protein BDD12DRAFT_807681 [Trichophaea hybrida]
MYRPGDSSDPVTLSNNHGIVKAGIAIFQVLYGSRELYIACGRQLEKYGYAAFSLTLVPYIAISLLNLLAAIIEPQYPCVFLAQYYVRGDGEGDVLAGLKREINGRMGGAVAEFKEVDTPWVMRPGAL